MLNINSRLAEKKSKKATYLISLRSRPAQSNWITETPEISQPFLVRTRGYDLQQILSEKSSLLFPRLQRNYFPLMYIFNVSTKFCKSIRVSKHLLPLSVWCWIFLTHPLLPEGCLQQHYQEKKKHNDLFGETEQLPVISF